MAAPRKKNIALEELLEVQEKPALLATIEADPMSKDRVKITPWAPGGGCQCERSVTLPKKMIDSLFELGHLHACCGKLLRVVEVVFKPNASVPVGEVLRAQETAGHSHGPPFAHVRPGVAKKKPDPRFGRCKRDYYDCVAGIQSTPDEEQWLTAECQCKQDYFFCMGNTHIQLCPTAS